MIGLQHSDLTPPPPLKKKRKKVLWFGLHGQNSLGRLVPSFLSPNHLGISQVYLHIKGEKDAAVKARLYVTMWTLNFWDGGGGQHFGSAKKSILLG